MCKLRRLILSPGKALPVLIVHVITDAKSDKVGLQEAKLKEPALVPGEHTGAARTGCPQQEENSRRLGETPSES